VGYRGGLGGVWPFFRGVGNGVGGSAFFRRKGRGVPLFSAGKVNIHILGNFGH
jgi:hypothetical protein